MQCSACRGRVKVLTTYKVRGAKYHAPGMVRVYRCRRCQTEVKTFELLLTHYQDLRGQYESRRQVWLKERADLLAKVDRFQQVMRFGDNHRLQRIREHLISALGEMY